MSIYKLMARAQASTKLMAIANNGSLQFHDAASLHVDFLDNFTEASFCLKLHRRQPLELSIMT